MKALVLGAAALVVAGAAVVDSPDFGVHPTVAASDVPVTERPPAGFSGGFGEPSCVHCHIGNDVNAFGGTVEIGGLPQAYQPGAEYVLTVRMVAEETALAGFQLTARHPSGGGANAGVLEPVDSRTESFDSIGVRYLHHTRAGAPTTDPNGALWNFAWTAPSGAGPVVFNVAANSGNGDNSPLGDLVFVNEVTILSAPGTNYEGTNP